MHIRNGQPFDIDVRHEIDNVQYPAGVFRANPDLHTALGIVEVADPVAPTPEPGFRVSLVGFIEALGVWQPQWAFTAKSLSDIQAEAAALSAAKARKKLDIDEMRIAANDATFPFKGKHVRCDMLSKIDILGTGTHIALLGTFPEGFPGGWKYTDETFEIMSNTQDFLPLFAAFGAAGSGNFHHAQTLKAAVDDATSIEQLDAIVW